MNKSLFYIFTVFCVGMLLFCQSCYLDGASNSNVHSIEFNDSWLYITPESANMSDVEKALLGGESVAGSVKVALPHHAASGINGSTADSCYYYRQFMLPKDMDGKRISLYFEGLMSDIALWLNGDRIPVYQQPGCPFVVDIRPRLGKNTIVVRVDRNSSLHSGIRLCAQDSLCFTNVAESFDNAFGVMISTFDIDRNSAKLAFAVQLRNSYSEDRKVKVVYRLYDQNRKELLKGTLRGHLDASSLKSFADTLKLSDVTLWSINEPCLYTLSFSLVSNGDVVDYREESFGFRSIVADNGSASINGSNYFLMGANVSHEYPYVGNAVSRLAYWRDAWRIKRGGFDFVNVASVPHPEHFLSACDRYGIVVLDTCDDKYARMRRNHPCVLHLPDSRGVRVYGRTIQCSIDDPEDNKKMQAQMLASNHGSNRMGRYFADAVSSVFDPVNASSMSGIMTSNRIPKYSYFFYQSQRDIDNEELEAFAEPICNILSHWIPGESRGVLVCSNCDAVELFVDGVSQGKKRVGDADGINSLKHPIVSFDVNCVKSGSLKAVAYDSDGQAMAEEVVLSPGNPVRIKIVIDESGNLISDNDILLVHCYILDNNGNYVVSCNDEVEFSVSGTAHLLSPAKLNAKRGVATCLIRTGKSANDFTISAKCGRMYTVADK